MTGQIFNEGDPAQLTGEEEEPETGNDTTSDGGGVGGGEGWSL